MSTTTSLTTAEDLLRMPDDGFRYELIEGRLNKMSPAGFEHGVIIVRLTRLLANHVVAQQLGQVTAAETGFRLAQNPDTVRAPDIAFIQSSRIPAAGLPKAFWPGAPDLAVEVLSPSDSAEEVEEKVNDWLDHGCSMVWVVSPKQKTITVYRSQTDITILSENETLDGRDVVPGFQCSVQEIFTIP
ncbi:MAG: Uma2 family endonuclease [Planctomycetes bacterium]|nr:Uma2 family endonuclease [Planctomycetota bacterium]